MWVLLQWEEPTSTEKQSPIARTTVHPHPISRFISVTIAAIDLSRASLRLAAGRADANEQPAPAHFGLVPTEDQARLLAVFNGGFKQRHGRWGMKVWGETIVPPRDGGCTLIGERNGSLKLSSGLPETAILERAIFFRQMPPCLVDDGQLHSDLAHPNPRAWGGHDPKRKTRRRSAIGLNRSRTLLFYALGIEAGPRLLAESLRWAGAHVAAQLDINWNWTRFLLVGNQKGEPQIVAPLVRGMEFRSRGYVHLAEPRDFFYVLSED